MNYIARNLGRSGRSFRNGNRRCRMASGAITTIIQTPFWGNDKTESLISSCNSSRYLSTTSSSTSSTNDNHRKNKKPFDKVLIANRGEIVQRVVRTCRELGIQTVAVYSTADAQAPFVQEADEAVCLGPAQASQSYLNTQAILRTIHDTGAQAVHPGYGFLSENANFAKIIAENNAVWLGPPARAISQMGDKLASKLIAHKAGVTTVPGHETPMESLEQALQLCEDGIVPYPVLLKAAAGGGGKGMRVCFNSQDLKEAWNVSKAESLQFFGDDRLLLEKYIENPHHIEFQVMCSPSPPPSSSDGNAATTTTTDVVVFPERECSIQRRNQKIIEESPSMLLTEETRNTMIEQVVRLCQTVGYESAGTLEFLVDEQQNFYFLEMNTRLQVEHCVSEEAVGDGRNRKIDLVKAMLWIGAGWGFPEEIEQMRDGFIIRPTRHAIEARIYAEDPTRAFLPSTGPLLPYVEPTTSPTLRVDSGVAEGHVVTPHYDPMLSKVIASSDTLGSSITAKSRNEAIETLKHALDEYVIEGVQHNARLIQAVLRNNAFVRGETPTSFLPTHFPDGFHGVELTTSEKEELAVAAVLIDTTRRTLLRQPPLVGRTTSDTQGLVIRLGGFFGDPYLVHIENGDGSNHASITVERLQKADESESKNDVKKRRTLVLDAPINFQHNRHLAQVSLDGVPRNVQVIGENKSGEIKMQMYGWDTTILVQSPREYELSKYMKPPVQVDTSSLLQSPMPGTLISLAVQEGDQVETGHELCIVEAMKMQNILKSPRNGTIAKIRVQVGESLKADQVILEFETE